jgi:uncharacterized damage-inducible protein DinB
VNKTRTAVLVSVVALGALAFLVRPVSTQSIPKELGQGWLPEFTLTTRQILQLAEATPPEKFGWRPAPGVRSISEVYIHIAVGNYFLLDRAGVKSADLAKVPKDPEKTITARADVIQWLRNSFDAVTKGYQSADRQKKVQFFNQEALADGVFLRILVHNNEHMGQSIAYARMNGIVPPWSQAP